ncbi:MAG: mandelate racemase/muconate lactonizing enzyme family protein [Candidatus Latescibacterota bacterium]|jgi:L-alanine-DL-glutamate epimerase-like enolase superfamily enzyme|nr:dehydratase [Gemmatimonadota bacterium]MDP7363652.1 mandelate racemase/muconate lactonizing enzyme family protein [Candidatus Latescibacterota bacterium]MBU09913.1 dehydratase [Gemmatimonadota bacterium]MEC8932474.1 mandelate racemase/muconate lactonizing enzyme family protein [Candidatus Latescibacterota bacterium]MEC9380599.1 mandelate racemase/muconate lactonizing enzyme family protein [Candidatus Latescibacterota bacterium]|tara:strand:- start:181 stop:1377 length:1197 start_codon:yes stop_codon:yes gene_type:complete
MKIAKIETVHVAEFANILFVRIHTDSGLIGLGETYYTPDATRAFVHEVCAPMLIGQDARDVETHWRRLYDATHVYGNRGNEMRAISAVDVALWDLLGQVAGLPLYRLLGGAAREKIQLYNTCAGPLYARGIPGVPRQHQERRITDNRYEDLEAFTHRADELAKDLLSEGIRAMKIWPFDPYAAASHGNYISFADVDRGLEPVRKIRDAVGLDMEIMMEGHGYWKVPPAIRIAEALEPYKPMWLEDFIKPDNPHSLAELRNATSIPICGSELALTRYHARELLEADAVDILMTDVTWTGGIGESKRIAAMAEAANLPFVAHDCTGPVTFIASIHLSIHCSNALIQESVRAYYRGFYGDLVTELPRIEEGFAWAPEGPGIGTQLREELFSRADTTVRESA